MAVAPAKVGPDYIDPGYHSLATGRAGRNLDPWICGLGSIPSLAAEAQAGAAMLVVEGVMGLYDGVGASQTSSTAEVASCLGAPVILVVDASSIAGSVAALVQGYHTFRPGLALSGVILNKVGSDYHEQLLRNALAPTGIPVLGALHRDDRLSWRSRHLGLLPVIEHPGEVKQSIGVLAGLIRRSVDMEALVALGATAERLVPEPLVASGQSAAARIALAAGPAFSFYYPDNLLRLEEAGAELVAFDPTEDEALPPGVDGLYAGGGFPEVFGERLADNVALAKDVRRRVEQGLVTWAECGGLLWLASTLDGKPMCGVVEAGGHMTGSLNLGYRTARVLKPNPVSPVGSILRGHEFHYGVLDDPGDALCLEGANSRSVAGFARPHLLASFLHLHLGAAPEPTEHFVTAAAAGRSAR